MSLLSMRSVLLAITLAMPVPALAKDWAPEMDVSMPTLEDAFAIRECKDYFANGPTTREVKVKNVCYQEIVSRTFDIKRLDRAFTVTRERTRQLKCNRPYVGSSLRAQVGAKYCPDTTLLPAPFLR